MEKKKYAFTGRMKVVTGTALRQIVAVRSFGTVRAGTVGGYVESEANLSHRGLCWVADEAGVSGDARVEDDAVVRDHARVSGRARIGGKAVVQGRTYVSGDARVGDEAVVQGRATLSGDESLGGRLHASGGTVVTDGRRVRAEATATDLYGADSRLSFGKYAGRLVSSLLTGTQNERAYLVWCYANIGRFDLTRDVIDEIGIEAVTKPGLAEDVYTSYIGSLPEDVRGRMGFERLCEDAHLQKEDKIRRRKALQNIAFDEALMCGKARLQAVNHGHFGRL